MTAGIDVSARWIAIPVLPDPIDELPRYCVRFAKVYPTPDVRAILEQLHDKGVPYVLMPSPDGTRSYRRADDGTYTAVDRLGMIRGLVEHQFDSDLAGRLTGMIDRLRDLLDGCPGDPVVWTVDTGGSIWIRIKAPGRFYAKASDIIETIEAAGFGWQASKSGKSIRVIPEKQS